MSPSGNDAAETCGPKRLWLLLAFVAAVAVYASTVSHGFAFDDGIAIERNLDIRSLAGLPDIFVHTEWEAGGLENHLYRPLTTTTYAVNHAMTGLSPWSYHLVNVLLHGVVSTLVLALGLRWRLHLAAAGVAALLFAVHPIHVEAVANVVGRKELLASLFLVSMALAHPRAVRQGGRALVWPALAYAAAMLSKEVGVVGIGLAALQDLLLPEQRPSDDASRRRLVALYATYGALLVLFLLVHRAVAGALPLDSIATMDNPAAHASVWVRWMTAIAVLGKGLALLILPLSQSPDYSYDAIPVVESVLDARFLAAVVGIGFWLWLGFRLRRRSPAVLLGAGWYGIAILPASNLLFPAGTIFGERLLYLPSAGLSLAVGWLLFDWIGERSKTAYLLVSSVTALALAVAAASYSAAWRDPLFLFQRAIRSVPSSAKVHHKVGEQLLERREYANAERELRQSLRIEPRGHQSHVLLGDLYTATDRTEEARSMYSAALEIAPGNGDALYGLGRIERVEGDIASAEILWIRALESDPRQPGALSDLGTLAFTRGDMAAARGYWENAVLYRPDLASAWYNLGFLYTEQGDSAAAERAFRRFLTTAGPEYAETVRSVENLLGESP